MKTSTIVIAAGAALVGLSLMKKRGGLSGSPSAHNGALAPQPSQSAGNVNAADVATNAIGAAIRGFAGLFKATGSGSSAPQSLGSNGVLYPAPTLGDYTLSAPYNPNSVIGAEATLRNVDSLQLTDTGLWASGSSVGGSVVPNYGDTPGLLQSDNGEQSFF